MLTALNRCSPNLQLAFPGNGFSIKTLVLPIPATCNKRHGRVHLRVSLQYPETYPGDTRRGYHAGRLVQHAGNDKCILLCIVFVVVVVAVCLWLFGFEFAVAVTRFGFAMAMRRLVAASLRGRSFCSASAGPAQLGGVQEITKPVSTHGEIGEVSGIPAEHLNRKVVIYSPSRCTTQSGPASNGWKISFESVNKWENPLMGWTSTGDPYNSVGEASLNFDSKERAVEFAEKYGWQYTIREPHQTTLKPKAYADNFKWKGPVPEYD